MAVLNFSTSFILAPGTKRFFLVDDTDYVGQGIAITSVNACFKITSPSNVVIHNNSDFSNGGCDIDRNSTTLIDTILLPLDNNGFPEKGIYTIEMLVFDTVAAQYYSLTRTYNNNYVRPEMVISQKVDCYGKLFTSQDLTKYAVNGLLPYIFDYLNHTINYPYGSAGENTPVIGSSALVTTPVFYNGTQTTEIETNVIYLFPDGLQIYDRIIGAKEFIVNCESLCGLYCCLKTLEQQMKDAKCGNHKDYDKLKHTFDTVMGYVQMVKLAIECGKTEDISGYLNEIKKLANCNDGCGC